MNRDLNQRTADFYFFLRNNFQDAAMNFCAMSLAKDLASWNDIWRSKAVEAHFIQIAKELASLPEVLDEDAMNDFVDERLRTLPWVSIAADVA